MTTTTRPPDLGLLGLGRTEIVVRTDPDGGRVRVRIRSGGDGPSIRPVLTGSDDRTAEVSLVPDGALLLAGDEIEIFLDVGPGVDLVLTEPGGTVAYPMNGARARWTVAGSVGENAGLSWHGMPFVATTGSATDRDLSLTLAGSSRLLLRETLVLGRHGEAGGTLDNRTSVLTGGLPLLREDLLLDEKAHSPGLLAGSRVVDQILVRGFPAAPDAGRLDLAGGGVLYRAIATETHLTGLDPVWQVLERSFAQSVTEE